MDIIKFWKMFFYKSIFEIIILNNGKRKAISHNILGKYIKQICTKILVL